MVIKAKLQPKREKQKQGKKDQSWYKIIQSSSFFCCHLYMRSSRSIQHTYAFDTDAMQNKAKALTTYSNIQVYLLEIGAPFIVPICSSLVLFT